MVKGACWLRICSLPVILMSVNLFGTIMTMILTINLSLFFIYNKFTLNLYELRTQNDLFDHISLYIHNFVTIIQFLIALLYSFW